MKHPFHKADLAGPGEAQRGQAVTRPRFRKKEKPHKITPPRPIRTANEGLIRFVLLTAIMIGVRIVLMSGGEAVGYKGYDLALEGSLKGGWDHLFHWFLWNLDRHLFRDCAEVLGAAMAAAFISDSVFKYIRTQKAHKVGRLDRLEAKRPFRWFIANPKRKVTKLQLVAWLPLLLVESAFWFCLCAAIFDLVYAYDHGLSRELGITALAGHVHNFHVNFHSWSGIKEYFHEWWLTNFVVKATCYVVIFLALKRHSRAIHYEVTHWFASKFVRLPRIFWPIATPDFVANVRWIKYTRAHPELGVSERPVEWQPGQPDIGALINAELKERHSRRF